MTFPKATKALGYTGFIGLLLLAGMNLSLDPAVAFLQRPLTEFAPRSQEDVAEMAPAQPEIAPMDVQVMARMPQTLTPPDTPLDSAQVPRDDIAEVVADLQHVAMAKMADLAEIAHLADPAEPMPEVVDAPQPAPQPEPQVTHGDQMGRDVPMLIVTGLDQPRIRTLLARGHLTLWVETIRGTRHWLVPPTQMLAAPTLAGLFQQGDLVRDPDAHGLQIHTAEGGQLREFELTTTNHILPLFVLTELVGAKVGPVQLKKAGLRVTPVLEAQMIAAQDQALVDMGHSVAGGNDWPTGLTMTGCWTPEGRFAIASAQTEQASQPYYKGAACAS